jgi:hypothetical protein
MKMMTRPTVFIEPVNGCTRGCTTPCAAANKRLTMMKPELLTALVDRLGQNYYLTLHGEGDPSEYNWTLVKIRHPVELTTTRFFKAIPPSNMHVTWRMGNEGPIATYAERLSCIVSHKASVPYYIARFMGSDIKLLQIRSDDQHKMPVVSLEYAVEVAVNAGLIIEHTSTFNRANGDIARPIICASSRSLGDLDVKPCFSSKIVSTDINHLPFGDIDCSSICGSGLSWRLFLAKEGYEYVW